ncbi:MAG: glycosyltransferase, partial [Caldilineaceae bacterium]|nr:glycosyltransferase [Caldilineaceae bacterium]
LTVLDEGSARRLRGWGVRNVHLVKPGVDVTKFQHTPPPVNGPDGPIRLLMASAPWTLPQFESKGVDALLAAVQQRPNLHLTLLWRGVLTDEIHRRIAAADVQDRVTLHDGLVDVDSVLATVHAAVVMATTANIVKAYPHSLLDALAAGKPVLVSRVIPMSNYVEEHGCGQVVDAVTPASLLAAMDRLLNDYESAVATARAIGRRDFSEGAMIESYRTVYNQLQTDKAA